MTEEEKLEQERLEAEKRERETNLKKEVEARLAKEREAVNNQAREKGMEVREDGYIQPITDLNTELERRGMPVNQQDNTSPSSDPLLTKEKNYVQPIYPGTNGKRSQDLVVGTTDGTTTDWEREKAQWQQERNARRAAIEAGVQAANDKREALLATGQYFDDGRGNIRLKKQYRTRTRKGTEHNDYSDATAYAIKNARDTAYGATYGHLAPSDSATSFRDALNRQRQEEFSARQKNLQDTIDANNRDLENQKKIREERRRLNAENNLAIYNAMMASLASLNGNEEADLSVRELGTGETTTTKDAQGRVTGVIGATPRKTVQSSNYGRFYSRQNRENPNDQSGFYNGFVGMEGIKSLNDKLSSNGEARFNFNGIIARQEVDAIGNKKTPYFYMQGLTADGRPWGKKMAIQDAYNFALNAMKDLGEDPVRAELDIISRLGDVYGQQKYLEAKLNSSAGNKVQVAQINADAKKYVADKKVEGALAVQTKKNEGFLKTTQLKTDTEKEIAKGNWEVAGKKNALLGQQLANEYEIAKKKAKNDEERNAIQKEWNGLNFQLKNRGLSIQEKKAAQDYEVASRNAKTNEERAKAQKDYEAQRIALAWDKSDLEWEKGLASIESKKMRDTLESSKLDETKRKNKAVEELEKYSIDKQFDFKQLSLETQKALEEMALDLKEQGIDVSRERLVEAIRHNKEMERQNLIKMANDAIKLGGKTADGKTAISPNSLKRAREIADTLAKTESYIPKETRNKLKAELNTILSEANVDANESAPSGEQGKGASSGGDNGGMPNKPKTIKYNGELYELKETTNGDWKYFRVIK